ncbi:hypothetical protein NEMIN01_0516 [Nematocida minor]|uniref:uncharacterized protein n=1 Tax=Nematocida minor TaxID=1912983 RepID=UPI00221F90A2|nr:uncharacterized protein NEMIN01_0516 [Nematocida minor]KAI5189453.1 hypothetical protein NEMIN01_0516 [Nematocida minor]
MAHENTSSGRFADSASSRLIADTDSEEAVAVHSDSDGSAVLDDKSTISSMSIDATDHANQNIAQNSSHPSGKENTGNQKKKVRDAKPVDISSLASIGDPSASGLFRSVISYIGAYEGEMLIAGGNPLFKIALCLFACYLAWFFLCEFFYVFSYLFSWSMNIIVKGIVFFVTLDVILKIFSGNMP